MSPRNVTDDCARRTATLVRKNARQRRNRAATVLHILVMTHIPLQSMVRELKATNACSVFHFVGLARLTHRHHSPLGLNPTDRARRRHNTESVRLRRRTALPPPPLPGRPAIPTNTTAAARTALIANYATETTPGANHEISQEMIRHSTRT